VDEPQARVEIDGAVLRFTFNRPEKLNAINEVVEGALRDALEQFGSRPDLRVMVINARGRYFSAGYDLWYRVDDPHDEGGIALRRRYREIHDLFDRFEEIEKPSVVAIQGPCLGGALELALSCDFRIAGRASRFGFPEIGLGAIPGSGGTSRATRFAGPAWARWLVMAGQQVDADRALTIGLVHEVHNDDELESSVERFVQHLAQLPPEALAVAKLSIELSARLDRTSARDTERLANTALMSGGEYHALVEAAKARRQR
jgi:enoyl-CoA hydratase